MNILYQDDIKIRLEQYHIDICRKIKEKISPKLQNKPENFFV